MWQQNLLQQHEHLFPLSSALRLLNKYLKVSGSLTDTLTSTYLKNADVEQERILVNIYHLTVFHSVHSLV